MDNIARGCIKEHVLAMPITQAHNVTHLLNTQVQKPSQQARSGDLHHLRFYTSQMQVVWELVQHISMQAL